MEYKNCALLLVDLQNDFCSGGSLAIDGGDEVIPVANRLMSKFSHVVASSDCHPADHASFAANHANQSVGNVIEIDGIQQTLWPVHCVQGTTGAEFHPDLNVKGIHKVFHKGTNKNLDSYSAFYDNHHRFSTGLADHLKALDIHTLYLMGVATDYCVKYSVFDAVKAGFDVCLIIDGCRGVELKKGDIDSAIKEMEQAGAKIVLSDNIQ